MNTTTTTSSSAVGTREALLAQSGGLVAVHDFDGVLARLSLPALNDPEAGLAAFQVRPGTRRAAWLPADLHTALGADQGLTGWGRAGEGDWTQVTVAALAQRIGHILVLDAWLLTPALLGELLTNVQATGAAVWLVGRGALSDDQRDVLTDWVTDLTDPHTFLNAWADRPGLVTEPGTPARPASLSVTATANVAADPWPHQVPDADFTTFRATCRDLLTPEQFSAVDDHLRATAVAARDWFATHLARDTHTDAESVARHLHQVWQDSPTVPHFLTSIRAYQVAAFSLGWVLQVNNAQLLGTANVSPRRAARTPALWARLGGYASPHRGAICALAGAGIDVADQGNVLLESVIDAGRIVILPTGRRVHIEDGAHRYVHAQKLARLMNGAANDEPLIADADGRPLVQRAIATVLNTARLELGLNLTGLRSERRSPTGDRWYTRWGISIQELT
ncbi:hypothetical protein [Pedococcus bigeumensis]|uniref:Uncharacterized protein n=1 Tax=Pedococcus bigeumensis TaxID=433644 RepID=A0A502CIY6_9MICO|nr:hypothetical protein [Pedococcus bigeumensis]TPG12908.1 hypothetical protein EAH86_19395 [Pedococcus bigeumensis]